MLPICMYYVIILIFTGFYAMQDFSKLMIQNIEKTILSLLLNGLD